MGIIFMDRIPIWFYCIIERCVGIYRNDPFGVDNSFIFSRSNWDAYMDFENYYISVSFTDWGCDGPCNSYEMFSRG